MLNCSARGKGVITAQEHHGIFAYSSWMYGSLPELGVNVTSYKLIKILTVNVWLHWTTVKNKLLNVFSVFMSFGSGE